MPGPSKEALEKSAQYNLNRANTLLSRYPTSADPNIVKAYKERQAEKATPYVLRGTSHAIEAAAKELEDNKGCGLVGVAVVSIGTLITGGGIYALQQLIK